MAKPASEPVSPPVAAADSESASKASQTEHARREALWIGPVTACLTAGLAFLVYWLTAAPDLTWAHQGSDGGDLVAAAVSGGVPHPSGYPLYTLLLQAWLWAGNILVPQASPARLGNLLSAALAAASVGVTVLVAGHVTGQVAGVRRPRWALAAGIGMLWAVSPLLWSQSVLTEIYTLHVLLVALLAGAVLLRPDKLATVGVVVGLGIANHLTFILFLPAAAYWLWRAHGRSLLTWRAAAAAGAAAVVAATLYMRIPIAAAGDGSPPPVNWGYADNWRGFWWLVSGQAYRAYFSEHTWGGFGLRTAAWARTLAVEFTPIGLAVAAAGLAHWDREQPALRTFALLWLLPVSLVAVLYTTTDSRLYLLPAVWLVALLLAVGVVAVVDWLAARYTVSRSRLTFAASGLLMAAVVAMAIVRGPQLSLRTDRAAAAWLDAVIAEIEPQSIVASSGDRQTFAVWYGAWGSGELLQQAPGAVIVNESLYQFDWYRRLLGELYPGVAGIDESFQELLNQNAGIRPIYFVEPLDSVPASQQEADGAVWRYAP